MKEYQGQLMLSEVRVEGLEPDRAKRARTEIGELFKLVQKVEGARSPVEIQVHVVLTPTLDPWVQKLARRWGRTSGFDYAARKTTVEALGISLFEPSRPPLVAYVILNHTLWTNDQGVDLLTRVHFLFHELAHVIIEANRHPVAVGEVRGGEDTYSAAVAHTVRILREEVVADLVADDLCCAVLRTDNGARIAPGEVMGPWFVEAAEDLLARICVFVAEDVQAYRISDVGLEGLYPAAFQLLGELLLVLAHAIALARSAESQESLLAALENCHGFSEIIEPDWKTFEAALLAEDHHEDAESQLEDVFGRVLSRMGISIEDRRGGDLYVHVHEPVECENRAEDPKDSERLER